jgi:hypothetical protein
MRIAFAAHCASNPPTYRMPPEQLDIQF